MKKIYSLIASLAFLMVCGTTNVMAEDTELLKSVDFTNTDLFPATSYSPTTDTYYDLAEDVTLYAKKGKTVAINNPNPGVNFGGQNIDNSNGKQGIAIPVTGVNGSVTVVVKHDYNNKSANFKVGVATATDNNPKATQTFKVAISNSGTKGANEFTFTATGLDQEDYIIWVGESSSSYTTLKQVSIYTAAPSRNETGRSTTISAATINGEEISAVDLATLNTDKTLTLAEEYVAAPAVKLTTTTTITYDSGDPDVKTATVDAEVEEVNNTFVATATVGDDVYTITVNKNLNPALEATPAAVTLTSLRLTYGVTTINVVGANLTGDEVTITVPSVDGLTCSVVTLPIENGSVNGSFTLTYKSTEDIEATTVNVTLTAGETTLTIPVTYSSTAAVTELVPVTGSTTWDWATASSMSIQLVNGQGRNEPVILSNFEGWPSTFPADAIEANGEWMNRGGYFQGHSLTFISTVPGYVTVTFSNTGGSNGTRNIMLNGTEFGDTGNNSSSKVTATSKAIAAGKFVISSIQTKEGGSTAVGADAYLRIYKVVFTPCQVATISAGGLTTFCPIASNVAIPEGVTAYAVVADGDVAHLIEVDGTVLGQGEGFVLEGTAGETYAFVATTDAAASVAKNQMVGVIAEGNVPAGCYVLGVKDGECVFGKWAGGATFPAGKAYLNYSSPSGAPLKIVKGDATGIESVIADQLDADLYNVNGQKVDGSYKGLVIKKGQKMLSK